MLKTNWKQIGMGFLIILCIIIFAWAAVQNYKKINEPVIDKIEIESEKAQVEIRKLEDSTKVITKEMNQLRRDSKNNDTKIRQDLETHEQHIIMLNKKKNEKEYIPNATTAEQLDYLSKYKYSPSK